jgi:flagellar biosynthetic protein FliR
MNEVTFFTLNDLQIFLLVVFRVTGIAFFAPIFASRSIPPILKIGLSFIIGVILFPIVCEKVVIPQNLGAYLVCVLTELATGALIGFMSAIIFWVIQLAGMFIDHELGFALANVIDPITGERVSVIAHFNFVIGMVVFLLIDGHHAVIQALCTSFKEVPVAGLHFSSNLAMFICDKAILSMFATAFKIAAPVSLAILLSTLALAFMTKAAPEMNVFMAAFAVRILVGLIMIVIIVSATAYMMQKLNVDIVEQLNNLIKLMTGG